jgi:hypothetical protein
VKKTYFVDHFPADIAYHPVATLLQTCYWQGLFSHRRNAIWKGLLRVELNTPVEDAAASVYLATLAQPATP